MTSKERLEDAYYKIEGFCAYYSDELDDALKIISDGLKDLEDLEVLEILKKQITITENRKDDDFGNYTTFYSLNITTNGLDFSQFNKIKEWLEDASK